MLITYLVSAILALVAIDFVLSWKHRRDIMSAVEEHYWQIEDLAEDLFIEDESKVEEE